MQVTRDMELPAIYFTVVVVLGLSGILGSPNLVKGFGFGPPPPEGCNRQFSYKGEEGFCFIGTYKEGDEYPDGDFCCKCPVCRLKDGKS